MKKEGNIQNKHTNNISASYSVIATSNGCMHKDGGYAWRCCNTLTGATTCEPECTAFASCVGLSFRISDGSCCIFTSETSCPSASGWYSISGNVASSSNDLQEGTGTSPNYNCKVKTGDMSIEIFLLFILAKNYYTPSRMNILFLQVTLLRQQLKHQQWPRKWVIYDKQIYITKDHLKYMIVTM